MMEVKLPKLLKKKLTLRKSYSVAVFFSHPHVGLSMYTLDDAVSIYPRCKFKISYLLDLLVSFPEWSGS